jgi:hypothetical protein
LFCISQSSFFRLIAAWEPEDDNARSQHMQQDLGLCGRHDCESIPTATLFSTPSSAMRSRASARCFLRFLLALCNGVLHLNRWAFWNRPQAVSLAPAWYGCNTCNSPFNHLTSADDKQRFVSFIGSLRQRSRVSSHCISPPTNPGLTDDGVVFQMGCISTWLHGNGRSHMTFGIEAHACGQPLRMTSWPSLCLTAGSASAARAQLRPAHGMRVIGRTN